MRLLKLPLVVGLLVVAGPSASSAWAGHNWVGNYNTGDFTQWTGVPQQGADGDCCSVVPFGGHATVGRFITEPTDHWNGESATRSDIYTTALHRVRGTWKNIEGWYEHYHWAARFPTSFRVGSSFTIVGQWHQKGNNCSPPMDFSIDNSQSPIHLQFLVRTIANYPTDCTGVTRVREDLGAIAFGTWYSIDVYVKWDSTPTTTRDCTNTVSCSDCPEGHVRVDLNGATSVVAKCVATMYNDHVVYYKQGQYSNNLPATSTMFYDSTRFDVLSKP